MISTSPRRPLALLTALLLFSVYLFVYSGGLHSIDEYAIFAVTESLAKTGQPTMNQLVWGQWGERPGAEQGAFGPTGDLYSKKGPATSVLALPFYALGNVISGLGRIEIALLLPPLLTVGAAWLLFASARALGYAEQAAAVLALVFGLATPVLVYSKALFGEPAATFGLSLALWGGVSATHALRRRAIRLLLAGAGLGLATAAKWQMAVAVVPMAAYIAFAPLPVTTNESDGAHLPPRFALRERGKSLAVWVTPFVLTLLALAGYNVVRFGAPWQTGYQFGIGESFTADFGIGLYGLLASPARGILFYAPILLASVAGWPAFRRRHPAEAWLCLGIVAALIGLTAKWWQWWGGNSWGPRLLLPLLPAAILPGLPILAWAQGLKRMALVGLIVASVGVQLLGALIDYNAYEFELARRFPDDPTRPLIYPYGLRALNDWRLSPIRAHARSLITGPHDVAWWSSQGMDIAALASGLVVIGVIAFALVREYTGQSPSSARPLPPYVLVALLVAEAAFVLPRYHARPLETWRVSYVALIDRLRLAARSGDGILSIVPEVVQSMMDRFPHAPPTYGIGYYPQPRPELERLMTLATARHDRLWLITWLPANDAGNWPEHYLARTAYRFDDETLSGLRLTGYVIAPSQLPSQANGMRLGEHIHLEAVSAAAWARPDRTDVAVDLIWKADSLIAEDYQVFAHLVAADGALLSQFDHTPVGSLQPTSTWRPGELIRDRFGFSLSADTRGPLRLRIGLYSLETGARLPAFDAHGNRLPDDAIEVEIEDGEGAGRGQ